MTPTRPRRWLATLATGATLLALAGSAFAQAKAEEEPFWAKGRPKAGTGAQLAPVPAFPIATAAADLPLSKIKLPPGFKAEVWASGNSRSGARVSACWRLLPPSSSRPVLNCTAASSA